LAFLPDNEYPRKVVEGRRCEGSMTVNIIEFRKVLAISERTFALLKWVIDQLRSGSLDLSVVHTKMGFTEAAEDWIRRNQGRFPATVRPQPEDLVPFARLFASYLRTSFEIGKSERRVSPCGCYCDYCSYLSNAPYLKPRSLSNRSHQTAMELKRLYVQGLATDAGLAVSNEALDGLASPDGPLAKEVAIAAYAKELIRRTQFATQGEGVYALWREFAWVGGHPDYRFRLTAEAVETAQNDIATALKTGSA
jgi:hypothetical protein